jgi:hypothetical protein
MPQDYKRALSELKASAAAEAAGVESSGIFTVPADLAPAEQR